MDESKKNPQARGGNVSAGSRKKSGKPWTVADIEQLRALYPHRRTCDLEALFDRRSRALYDKAQALGIKKTPEFLASGQAGQYDGLRGLPTRFKPGQKPWNAGLKGWKAGGRSAETQFKKGSKPPISYPIGRERLTHDGYLQRKVSDTGCTRRDYVNVHSLLWIQHHGPIPPLQKLGARLAELLDEDQFAECEALLLAAGVKPYNAQVTGTSPALMAKRPVD